MRPNTAFGGRESCSGSIVQGSFSGSQFTVTASASCTGQIGPPKVKVIASAYDKQLGKSVSRLEFIRRWSFLLTDDSSASVRVVLKVRDNEGNLHWKSKRIFDRPANGS